MDYIPFPKKLKKLPVILSRDEVQTLIRTPRHLKHRIILATLYTTGLRATELVNWELKSGLGLGHHQVSGDQNRSTNSVGIAVLAYLFLLRAGHHEITPGQSWSIFQLQHAFQLRAMTNQEEHNVKVTMAKGRKVA